MGRGLFSGGKVDELAALMRASEASLLIVHNAITSGQRRVLTAATGCDVYSLPIAM
jgi:50S ribosomal subunit-associated GTPase HflX